MLAAAALLSWLAEGVLVQAEGSNAEKAQSVGLPAPESCSVSCFMASGCQGAPQATPVPSDSLHPRGHGSTRSTAGGVGGSSSLWVEATNAWIWREKQTNKQKCKVFRIFSYTVRTKVGPQLQETWDGQVAEDGAAGISALDEKSRLLLVAREPLGSPGVLPLKALP